MSLQPAFLLLFLGVLCVIVHADDHTRLVLLERDFFSWRLYDRPEFASNIGHYRNSDRLEHFSLDMMTARLEKAKDYLDTLHSIDKKKLSKRDKFDYTILEDMLESYVEGYKWSKWNYINPLSWLEGNQRDPVFFVDSTPFDNRGDFENYLARLNEMPRLFDEYITLFDEAISLGRTSNILSVNRVPMQIEYILQHEIEHSVYFSPFLDYLDHFNHSIPAKVRSLIKKRGKEAIGRLYNAYDKLKKYLEGIYMPQTRLGIGVGSLQGGKEYYQACLKWYLSLDMTPEEVHKLGLREVDRVVKEMRTIMDRQGYSGYAIRDYFAEINKKEGMMIKTESEILKGYEEIIYSRIDPTLNKYFRDHPGLPIKVEPMPSDGSRGQYISGTPDGIRPALFYANTFRDVPAYTMMSLAMHESNPGHHLQVSYAVTADLPDFRRNLEYTEKFRVPFAFPSYTAYMEGWALYAESLGVENHLYKDDYELMGYYDSEIFRACRLVVDSGIHAFNWTKERAVQFFRDHTSESKEGLEVEIDRYITWPGQAVAYKVGELKIKELRERAQQQLGEYFDVRDFHMVVLENGAVPLHILEAEVLEWIENHNKDQEFDPEDCDCPTAPRGKARCHRSTATRKASFSDPKNNNAVVSFQPSKLNIFGILCLVLSFLFHWNS
ncbi:uncharacterized protein LOC101860325 [Aplysia californica]|uniref:Uncharacterized protein LOC101860325 n=1 Tax=Aplysia californica TaxID=6500 RepID=A0ABM0ZZP6_APLCA|nr:uncharacterized protein LOC101860325 [Aplysia californica]